MARIADVTVALAFSWHAAAVGAKSAVRWLSQHSGVPAGVVAAAAIVVGYRLFKRTARFLIEVAIVCALLFALAHAGWIRW